jgi:hypothetical protein
VYTALVRLATSAVYIWNFPPPILVDIDGNVCVRCAMALDREIYREEIKPGQSVRLVATNRIGAAEIEAIEDFIRHQRRRLEKENGTRS